MYEVGDKVVYQGADKSAYKKVGILKSIEEKDGKPQLTVEFEGGETFTAPVDDWSKEFTNAAKNACVSTNSVVRNAMAANRRVARNSVEVEISPGYAARAQYAMKDAARGVSGVRISGTNTLSCPDDDAADDVIEIIKMAGIPASEVWTNSRKVAKNGNEWIDDTKKKKAMDAIDAKADVLYKQLESIARKFDDLKKEQVKVGYYFADYSDAARQIREIHGMQ